MIGIIRTLIIIAVLFAGWGIASKIFPSMKNCNTTIFSLAAGLLIFLACLYPPESLFLVFASPEDAYGFSFSGEPVLTVDGQQSALVVCNEEHGSTALVVPQKGDGWGECVTLDTEVTASVTRIRKEELVAFYVYRHGRADDVYLAVKGRSDLLADITDNAESVFYTVYADSSDDDATVCYAHLDSWDENYEITVDGITYQIYTATPLPVE